MDKSIIGLVAAMGAAAPLGGAYATAVSPEDASNALRVSSVAELLDPVPNALAIMAALKDDPAPTAMHDDKGVQLAWHHHHHHHHHHHFFYHHHHHHHHHWHWCWHHHHHHMCYW